MSEGPNDDALVLDGFGLTRIRGAKATTKPITGRWLARCGQRVVLRDEGAYGRLRVLDVERLTSATKKRLDLMHALAHPDGTHLLVTRRTLAIADAEGSIVGELPDDPSTTTDLGTLSLGRPLAAPSTHHEPLAATDDDGGFAFFDHRSGSLVTGRMTAVDEMLAHPSMFGRLMGRTRPERVIGNVVPPVGTMRLSAARGRVLLTVHESSRNRATALLLVGRVVRTLEKDSLGPLVLGPSWIAWQSAPGTVQREHEDGRLQTYSLPPGAEGDGELVATAARLLFITPDRGSVVDVDTGRIFDRKLDTRDRDLRAELTSFIAEANARARPFDVRFEIKSAIRKDDEFRPRLVWTSGDLGLGAVLQIGDTVEAFATRWRPRSLEGALNLRPVAEAELTSIVSAFDGRPQRLVAALGHGAHAFGVAVGRSVKYPPRSIFEGRAGIRFLSALTAAMEGVSSLSNALDSNFDLARLTRAVESLPDRPVEGYPFDPRDGVSWLMVEVLGPEAWPTLVRWLIGVPTPFAAANLHASSEPLARLVQLHPAAREAVRAHLRGLAGTAAGERAAHLQQYIDFQR